MSEQQKKFNFFESLKKTILSTEENQVQEPEHSIHENVSEPMSVKSVIPNISESEDKCFKGISLAKELDIRFAENFVDSGGKFIFTESIQEVFKFLSSLKRENKWNHVFSFDYEIQNMMQENCFQPEEHDFTIGTSDAALSKCYSLSADEGVIVLTPQQATNRRLVNYPENHVIIAYKSQLKENVVEAIAGFKAKFEDRLPSVLELYDNKPVAKSKHKLLLSADGPKNVYLFYIDRQL